MDNNESKVMYPKLAAKLAYYGKTYSDIGKELGLSDVVVAQRMTGRSDWKLAECKKIALYFQTTLDELF